MSYFCCDGFIQVLDESMKSLSCYSTVFYFLSGRPSETEYGMFFTGSSSDSFLIPLGKCCIFLTCLNSLSSPKRPARDCGEHYYQERGA